MDVSKVETHDAVTEAETAKNGGDNRLAPVCRICEIEIKEHEETDFIIVVGESPGNLR